MDEKRKTQINDILKTLGIKLWPEQERVFWAESPSILVCAGEGAGKSALGGLRAVCLGLTDPKAVLGWVMAADFEDAYKELVGTSENDLSVVNIASALGVFDRDSSTISTHADQKCKARLFVPATATLPAQELWIESVSGYDPLKIGRDEPDFIIGAEVSRWPVEIWYRAQGRLARRYPRSWGYFSGSPEADFGWFPELAELGQGPNDAGLVSFYLPSSANLTLYPEGEASPALAKLRSQMTPERYRARHLGLPAPVKGLVFPEFKSTLHISPVHYQAGFPVYIMIDPGMRVFAALFVQIVNNEVHVLNEVYAERFSIDHQIEACLVVPEWRYVADGFMDVAGKQNHFGFGTPEAAWFDKTGLRLRTQYYHVSQVVERLRSLMYINPVTQRARLQIHPQCRGIISELGGGPSPIEGGGPWKMNEGGEPNARNDHALKALAYGLLGLLGTTKPSTPSNDYVEAYTYLKPAKSLNDLIGRYAPLS